MGDFIDIADLPEQLQRRGPGIADRDDWRPLSLEEVRKQHIQRARHVQGQPVAGGASAWRWPHQLVPLLEARWLR
jgi:hypothetical protein